MRSIVSVRDENGGRALAVGSLWQLAVCGSWVNNPATAGSRCNTRTTDFRHRSGLAAPPRLGGPEHRPERGQRLHRGAVPDGEQGGDRAQHVPSGGQGAPRSRARRHAQEYGLAARELLQEGPPPLP